MTIEVRYLWRCDQCTDSEATLDSIPVGTQPVIPVPPIGWVYKHVTMGGETIIETLHCSECAKTPDETVRAQVANTIGEAQEPTADPSYLTAEERALREKAYRGALSPTESRRAIGHLLAEISEARRDRHRAVDR